ncbi:MAG: hypothetical protein H0T51_04615 [Pirellulales bacterium]|nr:hypothetical protein [Pirellulales bacterium]
MAGLYQLSGRLTRLLNCLINLAPAVEQGRRVVVVLPLSRFQNTFRQCDHLVALAALSRQLGRPGGHRLEGQAGMVKLLERQRLAVRLGSPEQLVGHAVQPVASSRLVEPTLWKPTDDSGANWAA